MLLWDIVKVDFYDRANFMHIPLDRQQDIPLYLQIEEALRRAILGGTFADGDKLPSTRSLAAELSVSRLTVESAYAELTAKGLLQQRRGSGAYVRHLQPAPMQQRPASRELFPADRFTTTTSRLDGYPDIPLPEHIINFAAGVGSPKVFPLEAFRKILLSILSRHAEEAFSYGDYCGYYPLRDTLSRIATSHQPDFPDAITPRRNGDCRRAHLCRSYGITAPASDQHCSSAQRSSWHVR